MENVILIVILLALLGMAIGYIVKAKKRGVKCIGCSVAKNCAQGKVSACEGHCGGCQECGSKTDGRDSKKQ